MNKKINDLVQQMTLEEKAYMVTGDTAWTSLPVERLGIPSMWVADGPHGVRKTIRPGVTSETHKATCFPTASTLASSWDVEMVYEMGEILADECIALGVDVLLGPGNNMKRSPMCGRNFEYFSEDPFLGGSMAAALIKGIQSKGVGTSLKHFAANNQEFERFTINAQIGKRALREIYLAGFEKAVKEAKPWTVMCAYNKVNGTLASEHHRLLTDILKEEWGYEGFVMSDWGAVHDRVVSLKAGLDWEMPGPKPYRSEQVIQAVKDGELDEAVLDESVERMLMIIFKAQEVKKGTGKVEVDTHHTLARKYASEGMVLLKNEGLLPLMPGKVAVIGNAAVEPSFQGGGSSFINTTRLDIPLEEIKALAGDANVSFAAGYEGEEMDEGMIQEAVKTAKAAGTAIVVIGFQTTEGKDNFDLSLTAGQSALVQAVAEVADTVVVLNNPSAVMMEEWVHEVKAVLAAGRMGQGGGGAIADVLFGKVNPSGKLSETFPVSIEDTPAFLNFPGENGKVLYGEGLFIGYRYYDSRNMDVQFPFGHGLSYTEFGYSNLKVSGKKFRDVDGLEVSVDVTNQGQVAGKEVVQVYVHDIASRLFRPEKELKGFAKVELSPGETKTVKVTLDARAFSYFDPKYQDWVREAGDFVILVGKSSQDIVLQETVEMVSTQELPPILTPDSTIGDWMAHPVSAKLLLPIMQEMMSRVSRIEANESEGLEVEGWHSVSDISPKHLLGLFSSEMNLDESPLVMVEKLIEELNKQVKGK